MIRDKSNIFSDDRVINRKKGENFCNSARSFWLMPRSTEKKYSIHFLNELVTSLNMVTSMNKWCVWIDDVCELLMSMNWSPLWIADVRKWVTSMNCMVTSIAMNWWHLLWISDVYELVMRMNWWLLWIGDVCEWVTSMNCIVTSMNWWHLWSGDVYIWIGDIYEREPGWKPVDYRSIHMGTFFF